MIVTVRFEFSNLGQWESRTGSRVQSLLATQCGILPSLVRCYSYLLKLCFHLLQSRDSCASPSEMFKVLSYQWSRTTAARPLFQIISTIKGPFIYGLGMVLVQHMYDILYYQPHHFFHRLLQIISISVKDILFITQPHKILTSFSEVTKNTRL